MNFSLESLEKMKRSVSNISIFISLFILTLVGVMTLASVASHEESSIYKASSKGSTGESDAIRGKVDGKESEGINSYGRPIVQGSSTVFTEERKDSVETKKSNTETLVNEEGAVDTSSHSDAQDEGEESGNSIVSQGTVVKRLDLATSILTEVNSVREREGLSLLSPYQPAINMAEDYARYLAGVERLEGHSSLSSRQKTFGVLPPATIAAENLAYYSTASAQYVVSKWLESDIHRENILNDKFKKAGVGVFENGDTYYYVMEFSD